jgi:ribosome maturation factor RimP
MNNREAAQELKEMISPLLQDQGLVLVDLRLMRTGRGKILRLLVDRKEGGIKLQDCARLNQMIGNMLDEQDIIKERYTLEVSSPGLDRDLLVKEDFLRCVNRQVRVFLREPVNEKMELEGKVGRVVGESVYIDTALEVIEIPLSKITKAKQKVEVV